MIKNIGSKIKILGEIYSLIIAILSGMAGVALSEAFDNYWFLLIVIAFSMLTYPANYPPSNSALSKIAVISVLLLCQIHWFPLAIELSEIVQICKHSLCPTA